MEALGKGNMKTKERQKQLKTVAQVDALTLFIW